MNWLDRIRSRWTRPGTPTRIEPFDPAEVIARMNAERAAIGLRTLREDPDLADMARRWAVRMASINTLGHGDFQGRIMERFPESLAGEVVAAGQTSAKQVVDSWMGSVPHRAQILGSAYSSVGVGRDVSVSRITYWCADFV